MNSYGMFRELTMEYNQCVCNMRLNSCYAKDGRATLGGTFYLGYSAKAAELKAEIKSLIFSKEKLWN